MLQARWATRRGQSLAHVVTVEGCGSLCGSTRGVWVDLPCDVEMYVCDICEDLLTAVVGQVVWAK